jgi:hypothetical protein
VLGGLVGNTLVDPIAHTHTQVSTMPCILFRKLEGTIFRSTRISQRRKV